MMDIDSVEHDEFECSECDFRCTRESDMIEHSAIHQRSNNNVDSVSNILPNENTIKNDSIGIDTVINLSTNLNCKKESEECTKFEEITEMKNPWIYESIVKIEPRLLQEDSKSENCHKIEIRNKEIKFEHNDHQHEILPHFSSHQINGSNNINQDQTSKVLMHQLQNSLGLIGSSTADSDNNDNISTNDNSFGMGNPLLIDIDRLQFSMVNPKLINTGYNYKGFRVTKVEVDVDNTNIYVPEGWQRKLFKFTSGCLKGKHLICYISPFDKEIRCKKYMSEYLANLEKEDIYLSVDVERLNFTLPSHALPVKKKCKKNRRVSRVWIDVDNTEIYVPDGWQRRSFKFNSGCLKGKDLICYITPFGRELRCKQHTRKYLEDLERKGTPLLVDVDRLQFKTCNSRYGAWGGSIAARL
ncbi:unnamed protein product [Meganyctiphanes norvegica]|uniref:C2H2-type domain-containing protein n=1 Tax=Meganyctiphanes norvegica TaxID=48144 RepID=A0AAV2PLP4_MEGNR